MPEEIEIETKELQETIEELHEERRKPAAESRRGGASEDGKARGGGHKGAEKSTGNRSEGRQWRSAPPDERLRAYISQVEKEAGKEESLKEKAEELERESAHEMHQHH